MGGARKAHARTRARFGAVLAVALLAPIANAAHAAVAHADVLQTHANADANGWYPDQSGLSPTLVSGGTFGRLFSTPVTGQQYAQPLVDENTLLVATEADEAYGLDPRDGTQRWKTDLGTPWNAADVGCADLTPTIGVTGTPVVDGATHIEYLAAKTYASGTSGPAAYSLHALDVATGQEQPGFPVAIAGNATNAPNLQFNATNELQRPGLLLLNGVVYLAFGGHCDHPPYTGWVIGVSTTTHAITTMWVTQATGATGAGIWQSGGALLAAGPNRIVLATGNGHLIPTGPTPGASPPADLSEAVVELVVQSDGSLRADDFFTPYDAPVLDEHDADFGSGGPVALPDSYNGTPLFGTPAHPHLMLEVGKEGYIYMLDRDDLGGYRNGVAGADAAVARVGPYGGVWSTPAIWPGGGGYAYIVHAPRSGLNGNIRVYHYGLDGTGSPTLAMVAQSSDPFGFGSGSPIVTSDGLDSSSAVVWTIWQPDGSGVGAQLRAYNAEPVAGQLQMIWSAPIGTATKFGPPAASGNHIYVGTRDGHVLGFGSPVDEALAPSPSSMLFPNTVVGQTSTQSVTLTATRPLTVNAVTSAKAAFGVGAPSIPLPAALAAGDTLSVPITFAPTAHSVASSVVTVAVAGEPDVPISVEGLGELATGDLAVFPDQLSLGGTAVGSAPLAATISFSNDGATPLHVTGIALPPAGSNFTVVGLPAVGAAIGSGASVLVTVLFTPRTSGLFQGTIQLQTDAPAPGVNTISVPVSASATPPAHLVVSSPVNYLGAVRAGATVTRALTLTNTGGTALTITKSKPPALGVGFTPLTTLYEGATIAAGATVRLAVTFSSTHPGHVVDSWVVNSDDNTGLHRVVFDANVSRPRAAYWFLRATGAVQGAGDAAALGSPALAGSRAVSLVPTPTGNGYYVLDDRGTVHAFGDARWYGNVAARTLRIGESAATMSISPSGAGYWVFTTAGRAIAFGDAVWFGDLARVKLNGPIVSSIATPSGLGYYMVASDGGVFTFGDARFRGSTGSLRLRRPVVGLVPTSSGNGYWLVASDGGVFAFGDAGFRGSMATTRLNAPIAGMVRYGNGYLMVANDGGAFNFSNAPFVGSLATQHVTSPVVSVGAFSV